MNDDTNLSGRRVEASHVCRAAALMHINSLSAERVRYSGKARRIQQKQVAGSLNSGRFADRLWPRLQRGACLKLAGLRTDGSARWTGTGTPAGRPAAEYGVLMDVPAGHTAVSAESKVVRLARPCC